MQPTRPEPPSPTHPTIRRRNRLPVLAETSGNWHGGMLASEDAGVPARWLPHARRSRAASQREPPVRTQGEQRTFVRLKWQELLRLGMTPGEIRACYRLYAAHRKSHEICTFPRTISATSNAGDLSDLAVLLRLHTGLEGLARDIGHDDPNDDLRPTLARPVGHLRKMLASFAAQLFGRGALVER
jgi:hypothetical protein